ncbi:MAG TPA: porin [Terricaulis sp.]|nr:porin [Terricaulis sp.]
MKTWIIGAAALLAVAAPSVAAAQTGYVGGAYQRGDIENVGETDAYGINGAVFFDATDRIGVEVDAAVLDSDDFDTVGSLAAHVFTRNDRYLFGGFAAVSTSDGDTAWQVGVEHAKYFDRATVGVSAAYGEAENDVDAYGVNVTGDYFVTDNARVGAHVGWANVDTLGGDGDGWAYGVSGEYQLAATPVSFGLSYTRVDSDDAGLEADIAAVSVRYNFGGLTLLDRDRRGASQGDRAGLGAFLGY